MRPVILVCANLLLSPLLTTTSQSATEVSPYAAWTTEEARIYNGQQVGEFGSKERAAMFRAAVITHATALSIPTMQDNVGYRREVTTRAVERVRALAQNAKWEGGSLELGVRMGAAGVTAGMATAAPPMAPRIAASGVAVDAAIQGGTRLLDRLSEYELGDLAKPMSPKQELYWLNAGPEDAKSYPEVFNAMSPVFATDGFRGDPAADADVKTAKTYADMPNEVAAQRAILEDQRDAQRRLKLMYSVLERRYSKDAAELVRAEATRQMEARVKADGEALAAMRDRLDRQREAVALSERTERSAFPFAVAALLARMDDNPGAAERFERLGQLSRQVNDLERMAETFKERPWAFANGYLAAATIALELMKGPKGSELAGVQKQLEHIIGQLERLRTEMHQRFTILESKIAVYFARTSLDLSQISASLDSVRLMTANLQEDVKRVGALIREGREAAVTEQLADLEFKCMNTRPGWRATINAWIQDPSECTLKYLRIASADSSGPIERSGDSLDDRAYRELLLGDAADRRDLPTPRQYQYGVGKFLRYVRANPGALKSARVPANAGGSRYFSLDGVIAVGREIARRHQELALTKVEDGYALNEETFVRGLNTFVDAAEKIAESMQSVVKSEPRRHRPDPGIYATLEEPPEKENAPFLKSKIQYCDGKNRPAWVTRYEEPHGHFREDGPLIDERNRKIREFPAGGLPNGPKLHAFFDTRALWAEHLGERGFKSIKLEACFARFDFDEVVIDLNNHGDHISFKPFIDTHFRVIYTPEKSTQPRMYTRYRTVMNRQFEPPYFDPRLNPKGLAESVWDGSPAYTGLPILNGGILRDPNWYWEGAATPDDNTGAGQRFVLDFHEMLANDREELIAIVGPRVINQTETMNRVRHQLAYAMTEGLDMSDPRVKALYSELFDRVLPTGEAYLRLSAEYSNTAQLARQKMAIKEVVSRIRELAKARDLRPIPGPVEVEVQLLEALGK